MKIIAQFLLPITLFFLLACGGEPSTPAEGDLTAVDTMMVDTALTTPSDFGDTRALAAPEQWNCEVPGEVMEGNQLWVKETNTVVAITADSSTYDEELEVESHRILQVINTQTCDVVKRVVLPVNVSPDFPYVIARINYNNNSHLIAIRGYNDFYIYNTQDQQLSKSITPAFKGQRFAQDAQTGRILRLEVWEHYLIGYVEDKGSFVYDLTIPQSAKQIMPFSEYEMQENTFSSLFLLKSEGEEYQALVPDYNMNERKFAVNPLFEEPIALNTQVQKSALNNRYLVLRQQNPEKTAVVIDLEKKERVTLPANIATQGTQEVLAWVRANS